MNRRRELMFRTTGHPSETCMVLEADLIIPTGETVTVLCIDTAEYEVTTNENSTLETTYHG